MDLKIDARHAALLVMDFQMPIVQNFATGQEALLKATAAAIDAARGAGIPVIYVVVGFRPGFPEIGERNKLFAGVKAMGGLATDIHPQVAPKGNEAVVTKRRVGAFHGTDLEVILRAHDVHTLILSGISTSGVVLSTVRHAADADYEVVVLSDCCSDSNTNAHSALMNEVFPWQTTVTTSQAFIQAAKAKR